jgi:RHS repeat-associated protein
VDALKENYTANVLNQITAHDNTVVPVQGTVLAAATVAATQGSTTTPAGQAGKYWGAEVLLPNTSGPAQGTIYITATQSGAGAHGADLVSTAVTKTTFTGGLSEALVHDEGGNLKSDDRWSYNWDAENRLASMQTSAAAKAVGQPDTLLQFTYDYLGRRVKKIVTVNGVVQSERRYLYQNWNLAAEMDASGNVLRHFIWGLDISGSTGGAGGIGGLLMIQDNSNSKTYMPAFDLSGNVAALLDAADGSITAAYEYSPFGELLRCEGSYAAQNPFQFSTKFTDSETGLCYYGYRYYSPKLGRFINRDPLGESGGMNLYGFAGNSPSNFNDYLGLNTTFQVPWVAYNPYTGQVYGNFTATATLSDWYGGNDGGKLLSSNAGSDKYGYLVSINSVSAGSVVFRFSDGSSVTKTETPKTRPTPPGGGGGTVISTPPTLIKDPNILKAYSSPNFKANSSDFQFSIGGMVSMGAQRTIRRGAGRQIAYRVFSRTSRPIVGRVVGSAATEEVLGMAGGLVLDEAFLSYQVVTNLDVLAPVTVGQSIYRKHVELAPSMGPATQVAMPPPRPPNTKFAPAGFPEDPNEKGYEGARRAIAEIEEAGGKIRGRNITLQTVDGTTQMDLLVENANGELEFVEVKNGEFARLSGPQINGIPQIEAGGAIPVGQNAAAAGLQVGVPLPPTPVQIIRYF